MVSLKTNTAFLRSNQRGGWIARQTLQRHEEGSVLILYENLKI